MNYLIEDLIEDDMISLDYSRKLNEIFSLPNEALLTGKMIADFYEVTKEQIYEVLANNFREFLLDDIVYTDGKTTISYVSESYLINLNSESTEIFFNKRAMLRMGMLLHNSAVSESLRTAILFSIIII